MRLVLYVVLGVGAGAAGGDQGAQLANLAALVVALGTLAAGVVAYLRLRQDRPRVVEEVAGLAEARLREELRTAWDAVDRLREREAELEESIARCHGRAQALEQERDAQAVRITELEDLVRELTDPTT